MRTCSCLLVAAGLMLCGVAVREANGQRLTVACSAPEAYDPYVRVIQEFARSHDCRPQDIGLPTMLDEAEAIERLRLGKAEVIVCRGSSQWLKGLLAAGKQADYECVVWGRPGVSIVVHSSNPVSSLKTPHPLRHPPSRRPGSFFLSVGDFAGPGVYVRRQRGRTGADDPRDIGAFESHVVASLQQKRSRIGPASGIRHLALVAQCSIRFFQRLTCRVPRMPNAQCRMPTWR